MILLSLLTVQLAFAEDSFDWNNNDWNNQQDFNNYNLEDLIKGVEQNPKLLNEPVFFDAFENKLNSDPTLLNSKPEALSELGKKIGVDFSEGSGISSYNRGANGLSVSTKGCDDCKPSYNINLFPEELKSQNTEVIVNSDGSVKIQPKKGKGFILNNGIINANGDQITIDNGMIIDDGREFVTMPGFSATTKGDGIYNLNSIIFTGTDEEKMWIGGGENFILDLQDSNNPKVLMLGSKEIKIGKASNILDGFSLKSGSVVLESSSKYLFDKNSKFTVTKGKSESTFDADNNLHFCFDGCYGSNAFLPNNYEQDKLSTIELLENYNAKGEEIDRNILKLTSVNGDNINIDLLNPAQSFIYASVHGSPSKIGHINLQQRGSYGFGEPFYSKTKMDSSSSTVIYGKNRDTGEAYILGGSPILFNQPSLKEKDIKQNVQLIFLSNEEYNSEKPVHGSGEINLLSLFLKDQNFIETDFVNSGKITSENQGKSKRNDFSERQIRAIDEAKVLIAKGIFDESENPINDLIASFEGEEFLEELKNMGPEEYRESLRELLEYGISSGFEDELASLQEHYVHEVADAFFYPEEDSMQGMLPGENNFLPSEYDIEDLNALGSSVFQGKARQDLVLESMANMVGQMNSEGMTQEEFYQEKIEPLEFLTEEEKALFNPGNKEEAYENYEQYLYDYLLCDKIPSNCEEKPNGINYFEKKLNWFEENWE